MKKTPPRHFHVRLPDDLFAGIVEAMRRKGGKSLNKEIVERLSATNADDAASRVADALRPLLTTLDEAESEAFAARISEAAKILAKSRKRRRK